MKFLCDQCKAKYQIPDEKIAGRNLRMKCRKCSHEIIIRGPKSPESISPRGSARSSRRGGSGAASRPAPPRTSAPRSALGADFRRGGALAQAPVPKAAAVEWYVAINDVPVGPIKREEVARKIGMGAVSAASLCWREGLDDWRPVGEVPELATLLEQRRVPTPPPPTKSRQPPAPPPPAAPPSAGNVIPIGGRLGASSPSDFDEDDKTVMTSSPFLDEPDEGSEPIIAPILAPPPAVMAPLAPPPAAVPAPFAPPPAAALAPLAPPPAAALAAATAPPESPAGDSSAAFAAPPAALLVPEDEGTRKKAVAPGVMMGIAGAACFGIVFAVIAAQRLLPSGETEAVAVVAPDPIEEGPVVAEPQIEIPEEFVEEPVVEEPGEEDLTETDEPEDETEPATMGTSRPGNTTMSDSTMALSAEQQALLDRFGTSSDEPDISMVTLTMGATTMRAQLDDSAVRRVVSAPANRAMLQRCYNTAIRGHGDPPNVRVDIRIRVAESGRVTSASATGGNLGQLKRCLETSVRRWRFPQSSAGGEAAFPVVFSAPG
ncbi:MAG: putative Zn finger-like uncharacterized protein [Polyangiales bacterium]|jgi:predicted Zn finger-like uncharacterized protein